MRKILVTGGAGFIGSNFVRHILTKYPEYYLVVLDKLTYAGSRANLPGLIAEWAGNPRFEFIEGDICDGSLVESAATGVDSIINFAAETHVDRSLMDAGSFIMTDVYGTFVLLEKARRLGIERFLHISTDEVYGSVEVGSSKEDDPLRPRSPYSASKAGGEMMVQAYLHSYGLPCLVIRGSNNIGPYQYPEKVVPLFITNAIEDKPLPIYGEGKAVRDYLYVLDFCEAVDMAFHKGSIGEVYNAAGGNQVNTTQLAEAILRLLGKGRELMRFVIDRPGHDLRYSLDCSKIEALGWRPRHTFEEALEKTVRWYQENQEWWRRIKSSPEYQAYYQENYGYRLKG